MLYTNETLEYFADTLLKTALKLNFIMEWIKEKSYKKYLKTFQMKCKMVIIALKDWKEGQTLCSDNEILIQGELTQGTQLGTNFCVLQFITDKIIKWNT